MLVHQKRVYGGQYVLESLVKFFALPEVEEVYLIEIPHTDCNRALSLKSLPDQLVEQVSILLCEFQHFSREFVMASVPFHSPSSFSDIFL